MRSLPKLAPAPVTKKKSVFAQYHGVKVEDPYQWLENENDPAVQRWSEAHDKRARAHADQLPDRAIAEAQLIEWYSKTSPGYAWLASRGDILFALKFEPPKQQPLLVRLASAQDRNSERIIVDPNVLDPKGTTAIDWFVPSHDGKYVAVSMSKRGSEDGTLYFYDVTTAKALPDVIKRVQFPTAGGSAAWSADGAGIYYTRFLREGKRSKTNLNLYQHVYFHKLGTRDTADGYSIGKEFPRIAAVTLEASRDREYILATVANGDGGDFAHHLLGPDKKWRRITRFRDRIIAARMGCDNAVYLIACADAPRGKILRLPLEKPELVNATTIVPMGETVIQSVVPTGNGLYVCDLLGGHSQIRHFALDGSNEAIVAIPKISAVQEMIALPDNSLLFRNASYTEPAAWFQYVAGGGPPVKTALVSRSPVSFSDIEVTREFAVSKDGTKIPLNILRRKDAQLDGRNPTLLYGYGGYNVSLLPSFDFTRRLWFDRGGVFVVANIRGGGEFGDEWHHQGRLTKKQNVFDDFAAVATYLIKRKYTSSQRLAMVGSSNGGLLMGAMITQHPELMRAVVSSAGIYDMLRAELSPNGMFNVTEFGTVTDERQFKALHAYSPYHHVVDGTKYPAVLMMTGANDARVPPYHSRKMVARLSEADASNHPILLRASEDSGHGYGMALSKRVAQLAEMYAFLFSQLEMPAAKENLVLNDGRIHSSQ